MTKSDWVDHPDDLELVALADGNLGSESARLLERHLGVCLQCRRRLRDLKPAFDIGVGSIPENAAVVADRVIDALRQKAEAVPQPGEVWRVVGPTEAILVWVFQVFDDQIRVFPCSLDVELADEYTMLIDAEDSPIDLPLAIHVSLESELSESAFVQRIGLTGAIDQIKRIRESRQRGIPAPDDVVVGPAIASRVDERIAFREALAGTIGEIAAAADEQIEETEDYEVDEKDDTGADSRGLATQIFAELESEVRLRRSRAICELEQWPSIALERGHIQIIGAVQELAVRIVFCLLPIDDADSISRPDFLTGVAPLLNSRNDVARVALVVADPSRSTLIIDGYDVAPEVLCVPAGVVGRPIPSRSPLGLGDAMFGALEELLPHADAMPEGLLDGIFIDLPSVGRDAATAALSQVKGRKWRREKKDAILEFAAKEEAGIARMIELVPSGEIPELQSYIEEIAELAS